MRQSEQMGLFYNTKTCANCGKRLPESYTESLCPNCQEGELLRAVKDFIRENDVNEYQVAEHFSIPVRMVKGWIREGRIEYRTKDNQDTIASAHCQRCGARVSFGTLCPKCLKLMNGNNKGYGIANPSASGHVERMRFLDKEGQ